jgi:ABC-type nitrate/sulfonate/bicarbonate transport system substrate-binding protein
VSVGGGFLPLHAAAQQGMFDKHGVNVDLVFTTGPQAVQSLIAREVDVAYVDLAQLVRVGLAGADAVMLAATTNTLLFKLIAVPTIQRPEDLKGKRLGITRLGTTSDFAARYMLGRVGLAPDDDVALVQTGGSPELFQALVAGAIDAGLANEPFVMQARKQGYSVPYDFVTLGLEMPQNGIGTLRGVVAERPEAFRRFIAGLVDGIAWTKQNRAEALQVLGRYTQTEDLEILNATYDEHAPRFPPAPHVTEAGVRTVFDSLRDSEPRVADLPPATFIDDRFVRELEDSGYVRHLYP